jgi:hypothetical protein
MTNLWSIAALPLLRDETVNLKRKKGMLFSAFWDHFNKHTSLQLSVAFDLGALHSKHTLVRF